MRSGSGSEVIAMQASGSVRCQRKSADRYSSQGLAGFDADRAHTANRKPAKPVGKQHQQQNAEPERRDAANDGRQQDAQALDARAPLPAEVHSARDAQHHGEQRRRNHQHQRIHELLGEDAPDRLLVLEREAKISLHQVRKVSDVLLAERPIEAPRTSSARRAPAQAARPTRRSRRDRRAEAGKQHEHESDQHPEQKDVLHQALHDITTHCPAIATS